MVGGNGSLRILRRTSPIECQVWRGKANFFSWFIWVSPPERGRKGWNGVKQKRKAEGGKRKPTFGGFAMRMMFLFFYRDIAGFGRI
jgi:hypothetical protein